MLLNTRQFHLRTDVVNAWSGWPAHIWYFVDVPPHHLDPVAAALTTHPEIRYVGTAAGSANLTFDVWLRNLGVLHTLEAKLDLLSNTGVKIRRQVILSTPKRLGHLLDRSGRSRTATFPHWDESTSGRRSPTARRAWCSPIRRHDSEQHHSAVPADESGLRG
ncbi:hypothetical protein GCM10009596_28980 [Arthrobacter rhombi]